MIYQVPQPKIAVQGLHPPVHACAKLNRACIDIYHLFVSK